MKPPVINLLPCPECGEIPEITGGVTENKKMSFNSLRILHCCHKSPEWIDLTSHTFKPGV